MCKMCRSEIERFTHGCLVDAKDRVRGYLDDHGRRPTENWVRRRITRDALLTVQDEINRGGSKIVSACLIEPRLFDHMRGQRIGKLLKFPSVFPKMPNAAVLKGASWQSLLGGLVLLVRDANLADLREGGLMEQVAKKSPHSDG